MLASKPLVGLALFVSLVLSAGAYAQPSDLITYENKGSGIKIDYPAGWQVEEQDLADSVVSFSPSGADSLSANVDVTIEDLPQNMTLKESVNFKVQTLGAEFDDFMLKEVDSTTLSGLDAVEIVFNANEGSEIEVRQVWTIKNDKIFLISYSAAVDIYDRYYDIAKLMASSFEIIETQVSEQTSDRYVNADLGLQIDLPSGWKGIELGGDIAGGGQIEDLAKVVFTTGGAGNEYYYNYVSSPSSDENSAFILIFSGSATGLFSAGYLAGSECDLPGQAAIVSVGTGAGMKAVEASAECASAEEGTARMKSYAFPAEEGKAIYVALVARSEEAFEENIKDFENSVSTVKLEKTVDLSDSAYFVSLGYSSIKNSVEIGDASHDVEMITSSSISNFTFGQGSKTVSFNVEGENGTRGVTMVGISDLLEGPYTIMIDGKVPDRGVTVIEDKTTNKTSIRLEYDHSVHQISITGTQIAPEFGAIAAIVLALSIVGIIIATARYNKLNLFGQ